MRKRKEKSHQRTFGRFVRHILRRWNYELSRDEATRIARLTWIGSPDRQMPLDDFPVTIGR